MPNYGHPLQTYHGSEFKKGFVCTSHVPPKQFPQQSESSTLLKSFVHVIGERGSRTEEFAVVVVVVVVEGEGAST